MNPENTVFVVDDDPGARESVAALAKSRGLQVKTFESAEAFLENFTPDRQGCLVLDVKMTGMTGLDLQERLAALGSSLPVVIITGHADVPMAVRAMQAGALTFLEKPAGDQELWSAIEKAMEMGSRTQLQQAKRAEIESRLATLTPAENDVLKKLISGRPNKIIATELDLGLRTVELRRSNIMKKMQADSLAELVRMVLSVRPKDEHENGEF